mgnify:CR=1 FL=1
MQRDQFRQPVEGATQIARVLGRDLRPVIELIGRDERSEAIEDAAALMLREGIVRLPVVRETELVGIVTRSDIVQGLAAGRELTE